MKYRREIDGLRALAIIPVILFHAGFQSFSGGYVGVDIFFVISGYLITTILASELRDGTYSIVGFYERRARRILPALFAMLAISLPFAYALLNPADLRAFAKSLLGAVVFMANITAYLQSGYFDAASDIKPLMHLWSLAIEEQYYVFFPLLLAFLWRFGKPKVLALVLVITLLSLLVAELKLNRKPEIAFFYLHSRAWELGVGALLALGLTFSTSTERKPLMPAWSHQLLAFAGLGMIVYAIAVFDKATRFPGLNALVPTLGAALVIACASSQTWVGRLLGTRVLVGVGLVSYSAYLWHQPIFAFVRYQSPNHLSDATLWSLIALTMLMAYLSWRFVEAPFRNKAYLSRRTIALLSLSGIVLFSAVAVVVNVMQGLPNRYPKELAHAFDPYKVKKTAGFDDLDFCDFGDTSSPFTVLLYGDSHASSLLGELDEMLKKKHVKGQRVRLLKCVHTVPGMLSGQPTTQSMNDTRDCEANFDQLVEYAKANSQAVVVSARWTIKMYPVAGLLEDSSFDNQEGGVELHKNPSPHFARTDQGTWATDGEWKKQAVWRFLNKLSAVQNQVFVVYPFPEVGWDLPLYNFATYLQTGQVRRDVSTSYALYKTRNRFILDTLDDPKLTKIERVRPEDFFCKVGNATRCMAQVDWRPFYYDGNHLASDGARPIASDIGARLVLSTAPSKRSTPAGLSH